MLDCLNREQEQAFYPQSHSGNLWSTACHYGLQVQQGFTIPSARCQNKSTALLGQGKGSTQWARSVLRCCRDHAGTQGKYTLPTDMGCPAMLSAWGFFSCLVQSLFELVSSWWDTFRREEAQPLQGRHCRQSGPQLTCVSVVESTGTSLFWSLKLHLSMSQALVQRMDTSCHVAPLQQGS